MNTIDLTCPGSGSPIEIPDDRKFAFCSYCGKKLLFDNGEVYINVNQTININKHDVITDVAAIKRAEAKLKRAEAEAKRAEEETKQKILAAILALIAFAVLFFL